MGKVRINTIGDKSLEEKQKLKADKRKESKKIEKPHSEGAELQAEEAKIADVEKKILAQKKSAEKISPRSKKYQSVIAIIDKTKMYPLTEALDILPQIHLASFDETVELHINTHETGISGSVTLPHGTGKQIRVAVLSPSKDQQAADDLMKKIEAGNFEFDVLIATPDAMPKLAKFARILGPRGLMPNPKSGTVTNKPDEVAKKFEGGQVNFKTEAKGKVIHVSVGKLSFKKEQLQENIKVTIGAVQNKNIKNITLKSTMSPGIKIQVV